MKVLQIAAVSVTLKYLLKPLIDRLKKEGFEVTAVSSDGDHLRELRNEGYTVKAINIDRRIAPFSNIRSLFELYRYMKKEKFDIVHVHSPIAGFLGRIAAKMAKVPIVIYTAHGFYFHENMVPWKRSLLVCAERFAGQHCTDMLMVQSAEDAKTACEQRIVSGEKIEHISNGVDLEKFNNEFKIEELRAEFGLSADDRIIGFTGRLVKEKGIFELIQAVKKVKESVPRVKLLIVGDTLMSDRDQQAKGLIKERINSMGLQGNVIFTGFMENVSKAYALMDVFVLPSYREGMPRSIIEAMASKKPVIATNIRGCREEVLDGVTGKLIPVRNSCLLADGIKELLLNNELACKMGKAGQRRAEELFDENKVLDKEIEIYNRLINDKKI